MRPCWLGRLAAGCWLLELAPKYLQKRIDQNSKLICLFNKFSKELIIIIDKLEIRRICQKKIKTDRHTQQDAG